MFVYAWVNEFDEMWGCLIWRLILSPNRYEWMILNVPVMHIYDERVNEKGCFVVMIKGNMIMPLRITLEQLWTIMS